MANDLQELEEKIKSYEEKKKKFMEWIEQGEPNPVFKRLYKRKFAEIFNQEDSAGKDTPLNHEPLLNNST